MQAHLRHYWGDEEGKFMDKFAPLHIANGSVFFPFMRIAFSNRA